MHPTRRRLTCAVSVHRNTMRAKLCISLADSVFSIIRFGFDFTNAAATSQHLETYFVLVSILSSYYKLQARATSNRADRCALRVWRRARRHSRARARVAVCRGLGARKRTRKGRAARGDTACSTDNTLACALPVHALQTRLHSHVRTRERSPQIFGRLQSASRL